MPSSYTSSLRLTLPVQGELSGSWGNTVNTGITQLVDTAVAGTANITMTAADYTLTNNNGATDEARAMFLVLGGTPGNSFNIICPAVSKLYFVTNNTGYAQTVKTASGTGISVPNGASMVLRCDGTNVVEALNAFGSLTINTGKVVLPNTQSYAIRTNSGASCDVVTLTSGNVLQLGGGGATDSIQFWNQGLQRMTLDSSGNLGIGTSSPGAKLHVKVGTNQNLLTTSTSSKVTNLAVDDAGSGYVDWQQYANQFLWFTASTERMRLDSSGNLGIGISSPQAVLHVNKAASSTFRLSASNVGIDIQSLDGAGYGLVSTYTNHPMVFSTNAVERMRLDASGNLGLGVTPSAWSGVVAMQLPTGAALTGFSNTTNLAQNAYYNGSWRYISTAAAALAQVTQGAHQWFTAPSGTAGNTISFTQAMTLTSGGNLLVGTTNDIASDAKLVAKNSTAATVTAGFWNAATSGDNLFAGFYTEATITVRGSISYNRAGGLVAYNTTSDYRAKDIIGPVQDPGATIDALKVYEGKMKGATQSRPMLIAHEAQAVAPYAVSGVKDEVNEDGTPKFQQMDVSSLVPLLLAEIQSLRARVAALEQA